MRASNEAPPRIPQTIAATFGFCFGNVELVFSATGMDFDADGDGDVGE